MTLTNVVKPSQLLATLTTPAQELAKLSFCKSAKVGEVKKWVNGLHATQVMQTSSALYSAVPEIPRLKTEYANRLDILEAVRPSVQYCILGLEKSFLNQPLVLPEAAQKALLVAQSLQKNMIDGYVATMIQITQKGKANKQTFDMLSKAIHRAITGIGLLFFRNYQMYSQPPASLWSTLHILYQVASYYKLTDNAVEDPASNSGRTLTIESAYIRVLMLASAKTNQVSQSDIDFAFKSFDSWCQAVKIREGISSNPENFFVVNLLSSQGPTYKAKVENPQKGHYIELDFQVLLSLLAKQDSNSEEVVGGGATIKVPKEFPDTLLRHLIDNWSNTAERRFDRKQSEVSADVCIGFTDCHYYVCNGQGFDYFLRAAGSEEPQRISRFSQGITPAAQFNGMEDGSQAPTYRIVIQNVSAGGYCLLWRNDISSKVSAGEMIGVKELGKRTWSVGVIRWVRQLKNASQMGVQIIANNPKPYGLAQCYDMGGNSDYMRCLFIPPSKHGQGTPTLLTASVPFQEFDKVRIIDGEREWSAKLDRAMFSTKTVQQFKFRNLDTGVETESTKQNFAPHEAPSSAPPPIPNAGNFDSDWD